MPGALKQADIDGTHRTRLVAQFPAPLGWGVLFGALKQADIDGTHRTRLVAQFPAPLGWGVLFGDGKRTDVLGRARAPRRLTPCRTMSL
ncbi:hypothetical protein ADL12_48675 [Streptomyces regalis]|uniref:Uncharacterized protein n=1 Tax=Streptomyces regalis TaxID=68262 RepID=A0A124G6T6_9ACTN|nr:hypothetical protein ADL12_48675 [Streptomyces regalis]